MLDLDAIIRSLPLPVLTLKCERGWEEPRPHCFVWLR